MKMRTLFLALAAASVVTGGAAGFASAQDDFTNGDTNTQDRDEASYQQDYNPRWFSPSGFGPNDSQADETRALNRAQLENGGMIDDDVQGDTQEPDDADQDQQDNQADDQSSPPMPADHVY